MKFCNCDYCCFLETCDPQSDERDQSPLCRAYLPCPNNFTDDELRDYIDCLVRGANFYKNYLYKKEFLNDKV